MTTLKAVSTMGRVHVMSRTDTGASTHVAFLDHICILMVL